MSSDTPVIKRRRRPRVEIVIHDAPYDGLSLSAAVQLTLTRKGIEAIGFYDDFVGIEGWQMDWATFDRLRKELA